MQKAKFLKIFFSTPTHVKKNWLHGFDVHEALYQNCEMRGPGSGALALGCGHYGHVVKVY